MRVFLGLGSNLGDRWTYLRRAVASLEARTDVSVEAISPVYETAPVGGPEAQGPYLNLVVQLATALAPMALLALCQSLEAEAQRERIVRWGPRTLDVDLLWIDGTTVDTEELTVPHPRMHERNFVMRPLLDLDPAFAHPGYDPDRAVGEVTAIGRLRGDGV